MKNFTYLNPKVPCSERMAKIGCTQDAQCRSALQNMYDCDDMKYCPTQDLPYAGGLAWTSAGSRAIQCLCGQNAHCDLCDKDGRKKHVGTCRMGRKRIDQNGNPISCGTVEGFENTSTPISARSLHRQTTCRCSGYISEDFSLVRCPICRAKF